VDRFQSEIAHHDLARLESAAALYRGSFLNGFYDDWIINERYRLETLFSDTLARLMAGQEASGQYERALSTALRLLHHDPLREDAHRQAMRAYCRLGQRNAALEQYHRCRTIVQEELAAEPKVETTDLYHAVLEGRITVARTHLALPAQPMAVEPVLPPGHSPLNALAPTRLVGREREVQFLQECWQQAGISQGNLALIHGEAGVGKSRLAKDFASRLRWQGVRVL
jgi:tetratricopeptide (TPR) repeat protein